ncbi:hypothetical protein ACS0TY_009793 [Phlomoides rotata]
MESLINQTRYRFSGNKEEGSTSDRKIPPQKTQSFREKKRNQGWIKRQLSRQMSWDYDFSSSDYPAAVAAAAYAVHSLEESNSLDKKETTYGREKSLSKMKSKVDDAEERIQPLKSALKSPGETPRPSFEDSEGASTINRPPEKKPSMKKKISFADIDEISSNKPEKLSIEKSREKAPPLKRPPTFADKQLDIGENRKPIPTLQKPDHPSMRQSTGKPVETRKQIATKPGPGDSAADAWEKEEMISIKERYEKLMGTIDDWEIKKKKKAKRKIEKTEAESDKRRAKAVKKYHSDISRIERIAEGARAQAEQNRKNEEFKVKDKANKIRATGKIPATCLCF